MRLFLLFTLSAVLALTACKKDDPNPTDDNVLHYDGENSSGPLLVAGTHELAVRFPAAMFADHVGKRLDAVRFFVGILPAACEVKIYGQGTATQPGPLLYTANVGDVLSAPTWNEHKINGNLLAANEDRWVAIAVRHDQTQQSIGCDAGPRKPDGDWLFMSTDGDWKTYQERTGESVNWNIRLVLQ